MDKAIHSTVYIDEAGDLGVNRGTQWFVLSAVIVDKIEEPNIRNKLSQIRSKLNINEVHLRNIKEFNRRAYAVNILKSEKFTCIHVLTDTRKFEPNITPVIAYNFICRILIERVSWYLRDNNKFADIVLSARGTSRDNELINYIKNKLIPFGGNQVNDMFLSVKAKQSSQWDLLQLADVCATSMFLSHEINTFDFCIPCYASALSSHLYNRNGSVLKYGLKYFKDDMKPTTTEIKQRWICNK